MKTNLADFMGLPLQLRRSENLKLNAALNLRQQSSVKQKKACGVEPAGRSCSLSA